MKYNVTEELKVEYEVDIPDEVIDDMRDSATGRAMNEDERHELMQEMLDDYIEGNQPPREEWRESVLDWKVEEVEDD